MAKDEIPFRQQVGWVRHLPKEGGDWGTGIVGTVFSVEAEVDKMKADVTSHKAEIARIEAEMKSRTDLLKATVKRAEKEAPMLYANTQIEQAKRKASGGLGAVAGGDESAGQSTASGG